MITKVGLRSAANKACPTEGLGTELDRTKNVIRCQYDFAVQGGATGSVICLDPEGNQCKLPDNAIITRAWLDVLTTLTSGGSATVALTANAAGDILVAQDYADLTAGFVECIQDGTAENFVKLTAERTILFVIAGAALTAGKADLFLEYVIGQ